jgi:hypothetical protein
MRWSEELDLVLEEMRRVVAFMEWKSAWWIDQGHLRAGDSFLGPGESEGMMAYSMRQASMFLNMKRRCAASWGETIEYAKGCARYNANNVAGEELVS